MPSADPDHLLDEGRAEATRQAHAEDHSQAGSGSSRVTRCPTSFLRAMISARTACAGSDFTCTGLKKPVLASCANRARHYGQSCASRASSAPGKPAGSRCK